MTIRVSNYDADEFISLLPALLGILLAFAILAWIGVYFIKRSDNNKPLVTRRVKVLEKLSSYRAIEWFVVELENGERLKLRNLDANRLILSTGDIGILKYRGKTIESFQREGIRAQNTQQFTNCR